jgi:two-component system OmpR family response regulator
MKVLVVEDSSSVAERVKKLLDDYYLVDVVHTGSEALTYTQAVDYEVILLDLGLPDMHGAAVCRAIREQGSTALILSQELVSRVAALVRRKARYYASNVIVLDDLVLDMENRMVRRGGKLIALRPKEFDILQYLVRNRGRAISRQMILNHAWATGRDSWTGTVDVHIKHLRDKVDRPFPNHLIKTAYGVGYMVEGAS